MKEAPKNSKINKVLAAIKADAKINYNRYAAELMQNPVENKGSYKIFVN